LLARPINIAKSRFKGILGVEILQINRDFVVHVQQQLLPTAVGKSIIRAPPSPKSVASPTF
jgi:hypothetical protein